MKKVTNKALLVIAVLLIITTIIIAAVFTHRFNSEKMYQDETIGTFHSQETEDDNIFLTDSTSTYHCP